MALRTRARSLLRGPEIRTTEASPPVTGPARLGRRTKDLVKRLRPGEVAIIDHADLDRIAAEDLVARGVSAVVNVARSSTGRYANAGPLLLVRAGVRLLDAPGAPLFEQLRDGDVVVLDGAELRRDGALVVSGDPVSVEDATALLEHQRERIGEALSAFAENTMEHIREEGGLLAGQIEFPRTRTAFRDRHVLIVVRGTTYRRDLDTLRAYIDDVRPVLVGVDGGADAILEQGMRPDVVLGDMDSATDAVLGCGAELIVHAYQDGRAPGSERLRELGLDYLTVPAVGTSQDVAMLLAYENGAALIVSVGAHFNLVEFMDKNRAGMSSTFLTRLRIGETLVDAKGVSRLYRPSTSRAQLGLVFAVSLVVLVVVIATSSALGELFDLLWLKIKVLLGI
jgi:uncharacterized membrane-anchored protein